MLDDREKKIIFERFGLHGGKPKTLEDVSKNFGITRERIRQLQNIALAKLRRALSKKEDPLEATATAVTRELSVPVRKEYRARDANARRLSYSSRAA